MSDLEGQAKPILSPMIMGDNLPITISPSDQQVIATWAFKTTLMLDFFTRDPIFRQPLHRNFFRERRPPDNSVIWTGGYVSGLGITAPFFLFRPSLGMVETIKGSPKVEAISATATLYFWMFQVLVYEGQLVPIDDLKPTRTVDRIWPVNDTDILWPREMILFRDPLLDQFAERFEVGGKRKPPTNSESES
jgi:hypothetical protein